MGWSGGCGEGRAGCRARAVAGTGSSRGRAVAHGTDTTTNEAGDLATVGRNITELLRTCLVVLRLPPHAASYQPRWLPFRRVGDAAARISRLLQDAPGGAALEAFVPKIAKASSGLGLHCRAAVAATLLAGLELTRNGAITLEQDEPWQPIQILCKSQLALGNFNAVAETGGQSLA